MKTQINQYKPMPVTTTYGDDYYLTTAYQITQARRGDEGAINSFRKEVAKKAYRQNARYRNLENKDMQENSGAYKYTRDYLKTDGRPSYSVTKKMSVQDLVNLNSHLDKVGKMKTNSVRGLRQANAKRATALGLKFRTQRELDTLMPKFFELDMKLREYLQLKEDIRMWDYEARHTTIFKYINDNNIDLTNPSEAIDIMVERIADSIKTMQTETTNTPDFDLDFDFEYFK